MSDIIFFIGKLPPPVGGVTVFNQRKLQILKMDFPIGKVFLIEPRFKFLLKIFLALRNNYIVHLSASNILIFLMVAFFSKGKKIIFYDHNSSRHISSMSFFTKNIYLCFLKKCKKIILVDEHLRKNYENLTIYPLIKNNFEVSEAFLPPVESELKGILASYSKDLSNTYTSLLNNDSRNIILTSAFQPNLDTQGNDIYTIELLIDIFENLCQKYTNYYFVIAIANYPKTEFSEKIKKKLETLNGLYSNLIFLENGKKIWPLLKVTKLFIRATTTDGDSISLKEALYFGAPVLASNVVPRAKGVMLFDLKNEDLHQKIDEYLRNFK